MKITSEFQKRVLKEKLNYGAELVGKLDRMIRDSDLSNKNNVDRIREFCSDIEVFLRQV